MRRAIIISAGLAAAIGYAVALSGWSVSINGFWQDAIQQGLQRPQETSPVLLVEGGDHAGPGRVAAALGELEAAGAARVGVLIEVPSSPVVDSIGEGGVIRAWPVQPGAETGGSWRVPAAAPEDPVVYTLAAGSGASHRRQPLAIDTPAGPRPTLEAAMGATVAAEGGLYRIDYRGGLASLPRVSLADAATGDLLSATVRDRHVVIAPGSPWNRSRYDAPVAGPGATGAQVHAFALRTLLEGRPLAAIPAWGAAALAFLVAVAAGVGVACLQSRWLGLYLTALLGAVALACFNAAATAGLFLPGIELGLAVAGSAAAVFYRHERAEDALLARLAGAASVRAREREFGPGDDNRDRWPQLVQRIASSLGASRTVLLASPGGDAPLRGIAGAAADVGHVAGQYGNAGQPPFDRAVTPNTPVPLAQRLLAEAGDDDAEYLVRLSHGNETVGFWVFALAPDHADGTDEVLLTVPVFAERVAELVYFGEFVPAQRRRSAVGKRLSAELEQSLSASERRLALFEEVLARQDAAVAVYDVFGQPVHVNRAMAALGEQAGIRPDQATATDLLADLGGLEGGRARALQRRVVTDARPVNWPLDGPIAGRRYMLAITPLTPERRGADSLFALDAAARGNNGFLISFTDYTSAANLFHLAESLRGFINKRLRNDLINIQFASDLLVDPRLPEQRRERAVGLLRKAITRADDELNLVDDELTRQTAEGGDVYPLDAVMVLRQVVPGIETSASERGVEIRLDLPSFSTPALARSNELHDALRAALELVIDSASPGAALLVVYREDTTSVTIEAGASGYGMPDERLQLMLERTERDEPRAAARIRASREHLRAWGGELTARAALGEGVHVILTLRRVMRASDAGDTTTSRAQR